MSAIHITNFDPADELATDIDFVISDNKQREYLKQFIRNIKTEQRKLIIFYGPSESGKTFLLNHIYSVLEMKSDIVRISTSTGGGITKQQAILPILAIEAGRGAWAIINDIEPNMPVWTLMPNFEHEYTVLQNMIQSKTVLILADSESTTHYSVVNPTCNIIYITQDMPPNYILDLGTLIEFPFHIPSLIQSLRDHTREILNNKLIPDLIGVILLYF